MRIVLDTNVLVAAALKGELAEDILDMAATSFLIKLITSREILQELEEKLLNKFIWTKEKVDFFLKEIIQIADIVETPTNIAAVDRDPEDNKILECALSGKANLIVTSDQDLIKLKTFRGIGIVHPKTLSWTFPEYFKKKSS